MVSERARQLRRNSTDAERKLWAQLRNSQLDGCKFRRQQPIGFYVADFVCERVKLIVELDGGQHADAIEADARRTAYLNQRGYRVRRFWNIDVMSNVEGVVTDILHELRKDLPT